MEDKINGNKLRSTRTRKKICHSADELFRENGFDQVSVDAIVKKAEVSKGTFYVHFDSKDALLVCLISDYVRELDLDYRSFLVPNATTASTCDVLLSLVGGIADCITHKVGYVLTKNVYRIQLDGTALTGALLNEGRDLYRVFQELLETGIQMGEFRSDLMVDKVVFQLVTSIRGLTYEWLIRYPDLDLKEKLLECFSLLIKGLE